MKRLLGFFIVCAALRCWSAVVVVEWDANSETNLAGYKVYRGEAARSYNTHVDVGNDTRWTNEFSIGDHFLAVTAYDTDGFESEFSEELVLHIVAPPVLRVESNTVVWDGIGVWGLCWQTEVSTNRQIIFTNRVSLGMFPGRSWIAVRRFELGTTNVLSAFSTPVFFNPPNPPHVAAVRVRVMLQRTRDLNEPFVDFVEASVFDEAQDQSFYRARLEISRAGLRVE